MGQARILAGFVSKLWPHHGGSLEEWQALERAGLAQGFGATVQGLAVGDAAMVLFDSVSLDPNRHNKRPSRT